jgi:AraC-like DNA-binding protein
MVAKRASMIDASVRQDAHRPEIRRTTRDTGTHRRYAITWERIKRYIDENLGNPSLSAATIATATYVSRRQLYRVFSDNGTTVSQWVRERRLERCYRDLVHPAFANRTVAEIAYSWGFVGPSHFSRAFKTKFGRSPTEIRADSTNHEESSDYRYAHLIVNTPKIETWLPNHCDLPPAPGQKGKQHHRVLLDGDMIPSARQHIMCNWIDRQKLNPRNLPSGLSQEAIAVISGMSEEQYEDYVVQTTSVPAHRHPVNETLLLIGTDNQNPDDLGAEVELCLGREQESHIIQTTAAVYIPAGLLHCPLRIWRLKRPFLIVTILDGPQYV